VRYIYSIVKADYLQRTRSYGFLITLAVTIYVAYLFVPPVNASYTTLNVPGYRAAFNSAWVGYVSSMMSTVMLSFYGFLLVNSGIKKDIDTEVGLIIATTSLSNFRYLFSKFLSNFLVLLSITSITFIVSIIMFFVRSSGFPFIFSKFFFPYVVYALPALTLVASLAVVAEVFLPKRSILQFIIYFFLCGFIMAVTQDRTPDATTTFLDPFGLSGLTNSVKDQINSEFNENVKQVSFGFIFSKPKPFKTFVWDGISWDGMFLFSRVIWMVFAICLIYFSSLFFHRFDINPRAGKKIKTLVKEPIKEKTDSLPSGINRVLIPPIEVDYSILPFLKTEILLLVRKGNKVFWLLIFALWLSMFFAPLSISHIYLLPVLWFLQVTRWSDIATKEKTSRVHYFSYASYRPLVRMLPAQMLAGILFAIILAIPLLLRYLLIQDLISMLFILNGAIFIILSAVCLGILSGGNKLYEILFFLLTYCSINQIPFLDYLGSQQHSNPVYFLVIFVSLNIAFSLISFIARAYQSRHL
jgi:hypothetical protein